MKKIVIFLVSVVIIATVEAKGKKDPVVMTVVDKEIPLSEFVFMAKKDNNVDLNDKKSVRNYVELFKNYKLKVADAEALTIHKAPKFERELESYKDELQASFLSDKTGEDSALHVIYNRTKSIPGFKHILFRFEKNEVLTKDTVALYNKALAVYNRIKNGESFEAIGESFKEADGDSVIYVNVEYIYPLQMLKVVEDKVFTMDLGEVSEPLRSMAGYHLIKKDRDIPNPGKVRIAHILSEFSTEEPTEEEIEETRKRADSVYNKAISGEDFAELAKAYSNDTVSAGRGGVMAYFGLGEKIEPLETAAFALENAGDISKPVQTRFGFHVIKLIDRKTEITFEEMESFIYESMKSSERNFDLYGSFDEKMKLRHGYVFYPEAYEELSLLADDYFPTDTLFFDIGIKMEKTLIRLDSIDFSQSVFVEYIYRKPYSTKTYSQDFMAEIFKLFIRDIVTEMERRTLERDYPDYNMLVNEYYDGILLYEISSKRVWGHPVEEQAALEAEWVKELNEKYPVTINWKVINKVKKYLN